MHHQDDELILGDHRQVIADELHLLLAEPALVAPPAAFLGDVPDDVVEHHEVDGTVVERVVRRAVDPFPCIV